MNPKQNIQFFIIAFLISFFAFWGLNLFQKEVEEIFYWQKISEEPYILLADININLHHKDKNESLISEEKPEINLSVESFISVLITSDGKQKVIFEKNANKKRAIASITKLVTAIVAEEIYQPDQILFISKRAVEQESQAGRLSPGEALSVNQLMHIMLIESSNDAAFALAEGITKRDSTTTNKDHFVDLMNKKTKEIGLKNTFFNNPTGLNGLENYSTASDLAKLASYILKNHPEIFEITRYQSWRVIYPNGETHHYITENTNKLLAEIPEIIGGKTGYTEEAGGCIILVLKRDNNYLINVILGADSPESRFVEMKKLIEYCDKII
ncbi:D-alanyl-D-alanine carboxypeptidase [bacterium]|nr:D-alanyl-D-alanine carboxypeptidase [bacterium]